MPSSVRCVPTSGIAISAGTNVPTSGAGGGERIEAPCHGAGGSDIGDRQADRERRDHPQRDNGRGEEEENGDERADHCARRSVVEITDRRVEKRPGEERRQRNPDRRCENDQAQQAWLRPSVGEPPSEPVAEGEPGEHIWSCSGSMTSLIAMNVSFIVFTDADFPWAIFPLVGWGIGLMLH